MRVKTERKRARKHARTHVQHTRFLESIIIIQAQLFRVIL